MMRLLSLLMMFQGAHSLASVGDIKGTFGVLSKIPTDDRLFTQERKDKYLLMITNYLAQYK